jgi:hypothetical protein
VAVSESFRARFERWKIEDLLLKYSGLRLTTHLRGGIIIAGALSFVMESPGKDRITDEYRIELSIPDDFPEVIPSVRETSGRIPGTFHRLDNGTLCLGSPTRLRLTLTEAPSIVAFVERCVIPYLYGHSYFEKHGVMPFGELEHGEAGLRQDLASLFGGVRQENVHEFVRLVTMRKRLANKQPCPCGSQRRLGRCHHSRVNALRKRLGRHWFRSVNATLARQ